MARLTDIHAMKPCTWQHPRKIGHNTLAWKDNTGDFAIRYHSTVVVQYDSATRTLYVNTSGWFSVTTLQRIRHGLDYLGLRLSTSDLKGKWRVMDYHGNAYTIRGNSITLRKVTDWADWQRIER